MFLVFSLQQLSCRISATFNSALHRADAMHTDDGQTLYHTLINFHSTEHVSLMREVAELKDRVQKVEDEVTLMRLSTESKRGRL